MRVLSFDVESNGLWGQPFAIGALVLNDQGVEIDRFFARSPIKGKTHSYVRETILPAMMSPNTHKNCRGMLGAFSIFYLRWRRVEGTVIVTHIPFPVEARFLQDLRDRSLIGDLDMPYPLIDVAGCLAAVGEDPTSVDRYAAKHGIGTDPTTYGGGAHNPLWDAAQAAAVYRHICCREVGSATTPPHGGARGDRMTTRIVPDYYERLRLQAAEKLRRAKKEFPPGVEITPEEVHDPWRQSGYYHG